MPLTEDSIRKIQQKYGDLLNYGPNDPSEPIEPISYITPDGDTLLHIAAGRGDRETVDILLSAGMNPSLKGDMGYTPLNYAADAGHSDIVDLLIKRGANGWSTTEFSS